MRADKNRKVGDTRKKKLAVVLFGERVSPHFGSSSNILLVEYKGGIICEKGVRNLGVTTSIELAQRLADLGIDLLVCGGIQQSCKKWLVGRGIMVIDNQKGQAEDLVREVLCASGIKYDV